MTPQSARDTTFFQFLHGHFLLFMDILPNIVEGQNFQRHFEQNILRTIKKKKRALLCFYLNIFDL